MSTSSITPEQIQGLPAGAILRPIQGLPPGAIVRPITAAKPTLNPYQQAAERYTSPGNVTMSAGTPKPPAEPPGFFQRLATAIGIPTSQGETTTAVQNTITPQPEPGAEGLLKFEESLPVLGSDFRARADLARQGRPTSLIPFIGPAIARYVDAANTEHPDIATQLGTGINVAGQASGLKSLLTPKPPVPIGETLSDVALRPPTAPVNTTTTLPKTGAVRSVARNYMGIGTKMAERTATEAMGEHANTVGATQEANAAALAKHEANVGKVSVKQTQLNEQTSAANKAATQEMVKKQSASYAETEHTNQLAIAEHAEEVQRINKLNEAGQEAVGERSRLGQQITENSTKLNEQLKAVEQRVRAEGQAKYQAVEAATQGDEIPATRLSDAVNHAEKNLIQGTPESIKQFRDLLQKGEPQDVSTSVGVATPGTPLYETLVREGAIHPSETMGFRDLQGYYTELGQKMMAQNVPGDVYRALRYVRDQVGKEMQAMAERHGAGDVLTDARVHWRQYEQTFHDMRPVAQGGSPVARALRASDPAYTAAPFLGKSATRAVDMLDKYDPGTAMQAARLASDYNRMSSLPSKFNLKEVPEAPATKLPKIYEKPEPQQARQLEAPKGPELEQPEGTPDLGKAIREARENRIGKISGNLRSVSGWDVASVSGGLYQMARGELPSAFGITVLRHGLGAVLDHPRVIEWLSKPTREDFAAFDKIPSEQRSAVQQAVTDVYVKQAEAGKPLPLDDAAKRFLTPAQVKQIEGNTNSTVERGIKPPQQRTFLRTTQADVKDYYNYRFDQLREEMKAADTPEAQADVSRRMKELDQVQRAHPTSEGGITPPKAPVTSAGQITPEHVAAENAFYTQARAELGADVSPSAVLQRAQALKIEHAAKGAPPPITPIPPTVRPTLTQKMAAQPLPKLRPVARPSQSASTTASTSQSPAQQATAIMLMVKQGKLSAAEADSKIQRLVGPGGRRTIRRPIGPE